MNFLVADFLKNEDFGGVIGKLIINIMEIRSHFHWGQVSV